LSSVSRSRASHVYIDQSHRVLRTRELQKSLTAATRTATSVLNPPVRGSRVLSASCGCILKEPLHRYWQLATTRHREPLREHVPRTRLGRGSSHDARREPRHATPPLGHRRPLSPPARLRLCGALLAGAPRHLITRSRMPCPLAADRRPQRRHQAISASWPSPCLD